jgi:hypothetical protein
VFKNNNIEVAMRQSNPLRIGALVLLLVLCGLALAACGNSQDCELEEAAAEATLTAMPTSTPQSTKFVQTKWEAGGHADTFVADDNGMNATCARCHAPLSWVPVGDEIPASWASSEIDIGLPVETIAESEWTAVECKICHREGEDEISGDIAWLEIAPLGEYSEVASAAELCEKCHLADAIEGHLSIVVQGSHLDFVCTDCHDPHDNTATCSGSGCHEAFTAECKTLDGHTRPHSDSACGACHDAGGLEIDWDGERGMWQTFLPPEISSEDEARPFVSHNLSLEVPCERCHEPGNHPWGDSIEAYD